MVSIIAIITLSLIVSYLVWKLIPLSIEVGEFRENRRLNIEPEITYFTKENKRLWYDIEDIINGSEVTIRHCKKVIEDRKKSEESFHKMLQKIK